MHEMCLYIALPIERGLTIVLLVSVCVFLSSASASSKPTIQLLWPIRFLLLLMKSKMVVLCVYEHRSGFFLWISYAHNCAPKKKESQRGEKIKPKRKMIIQYENDVLACSKNSSNGNDKTHSSTFDINIIPTIS